MSKIQPPFTESEPRLFMETGVEGCVATLVIPELEALGFRLVRVRLSNNNGLTVQIMAERLDGSLTIEDCERLSRHLSPILDVEDIIDKHYHLEISSPGIDRPLVRKSDFSCQEGHLARVELHTAIEGKKRLQGLLGEVTPTYFALYCRNETEEESQHLIPFDNLKHAQLILTDKLIEETLKKEKARKKAAKGQNSRLATNTSAGA